jgi:hypothetical protein
LRRTETSHAENGQCSVAEKQLLRIDFTDDAANAVLSVRQSDRLRHMDVVRQDTLDAFFRARDSIGGASCSVAGSSAC